MWFLTTTVGPSSIDGRGEATDAEEAKRVVEVIRRVQTVMSGERLLQ